MTEGTAGAQWLSEDLEGRQLRLQGGYISTCTSQLRPLEGRKGLLAACRASDAVSLQVSSLGRGARLAVYNPGL